MRKCNGTVAWRLTATAFNAPPAYHAATNTVLAGGENGVLYKLDALSGAIQATYNAGGALNKAILLAGNVVYALTENGYLHSLNVDSLTLRWVYSAGSGAATPPAYSAVRDVVVFCTDDLYVHAVNGANGTRRWRVKPSPNTPGGPPTWANSFEFSWPVIAEQHGIVLVRQTTDNYDDLWGPGPMGRYPNTNAQIRAYLQANPSKKNLFALDLNNGSERFVTAVGPGFLEVFSEGGTVGGIVGCPPVVRQYSDGTEVAYVLWRCGQTTANGNPVDGRWDSQVGEMVLDNSTVPGLVAGDLRRVQWIDSFVITDEQGPFVMAGDTLLYAHWAFCEHGRITDRGPTRGLDSNWNNPIQVEFLPSMVRWIAGQGSPNVQTHWYEGELVMYGDPRSRPGPGWWGYWNVWGPDSGYAMRYTLVADDMVLIMGGGGDLFAFTHSGRPRTPTIASGPASQTVPAGGTATFSVVAFGPGRTYQWHRNGVPLVDNNRVSGSRSATLTISPVVPADAGQYIVVVSNACGQATSPAATLTVSSAVLGDADGDGDADLLDAARLQQCMMLPPTGACAACDWTLDGIINAQDMSVMCLNMTGPLGN